MKILRFYRLCSAFMLLGITPSLMAKPTDCSSLLESNQQQMGKLQGYVAELSEHADQLNLLLEQARLRSEKQSTLIQQLEKKQIERRNEDFQYQQNVRQHFFAQLAKYLGASPVYRLKGQALLIASDSVFIFGKGKLGAEGEARLKPVASALILASQFLPKNLNWRLRIEGHTDSRPLHNNKRFPTNWELSAARAVGVLRYLIRQGLKPNAVVATGLADTKLLDLGNKKANHRRNRRIEIHLQF